MWVEVEDEPNLVFEFWIKRARPEKGSWGKLPFSDRDENTLS